MSKDSFQLSIICVNPGHPTLHVEDEWQLGAEPQQLPRHVLLKKHSVPLQINEILARAILLHGLHVPTRSLGIVLHGIRIH